MSQASEGELRCEVCRYHPLLARYGRDDKGNLYVHVKVFKQKRLFAEMVVTSGTVRLRCRDCFRWHTVRIAQPHRVDIREEELPQEIPVA